MFSLRWLRKAVSRPAGVLPLHDEAAAHTKGVRTQQRQGKAGHEAIDRVALPTTFKTVMFECVEVVFIVIALGAGATLLTRAAAGAVPALLLATALALVWACTSMRAKVARPERAPSAGSSARPGALAGVASELFGPFVGDGWLAAVVLLCVAAGWAMALGDGLPSLAASIIFAMVLFLVLGVSTIRRAAA